MAIPETEVSPMEKILKNPGLEHLAENIFGNLSDEDVEVCRDINQSSREILDNPMFWLRKFRSLSKENQKEWINVIQSVKNSEKVKAIISYLKWKLKKEAMVDLPCYSRHAVQVDFRMKIWESCGNFRWKSRDEDTEIVKIIAPLTDNPNTPDKYGRTPMYWAAQYGYTEIVKILASLTDNPNAADQNGETPIYRAACNGHTEIVKILAPLTDNPNTPDQDGKTPIYSAALRGHTEIVKFLAHLTENPNAPNKNGKTPSSVTKNADIRKFLKSFKVSA